MKTRKLVLALMMIAGIALVFAGCQKDETIEPQNVITQDEEVDAAEENALADQLFTELTDITNEAMSNADKSLKGIMLDTIFMGPCVTVTIDTLALPFTITIDFGETNCLCNDDKYRRGKILVTHSGAYWGVGTQITTTLDNYFVDDHQVIGTKVATNQGPNTAGNPTWSVSVDGQIIKPDGGVIEWDAERMREWSEGHNTPFIWWDDVYLLSGTQNVVASNGTSINMVIINPLQIALNCYWIEKGTIEMQHSDLPLMIFDYGDGTCDDQATVTINGVVYPITL